MGPSQVAVDERAAQPAAATATSSGSGAGLAAAVSSVQSILTSIVGEAAHSAPRRSARVKMVASPGWFAQLSQLERGETSICHKEQEYRAKQAQQHAGCR